MGLRELGSCTDWSSVRSGKVVEEIYKDRAAFSEKVREHTDADMNAMGFELVRSLPVWHEKIMDSVFLK